MANKKYKALQDVSIGDMKHEKGKTFEAASNSGHITTALHFKQIAEVKEKSEAKADDAEAAAKAKAEAEKKEREAAEAKAKEEAADKAGGNK